ncbi:MAG: hypothetical protein QOF76_4327 [Solirubrobacteraceae bacterium]|nr:hypothetical protein [Solirubrobacteraceae bacterium]
MHPRMLLLAAVALALVLASGAHPRAGRADGVYDIPTPTPTPTPARMVIVVPPRLLAVHSRVHVACTVDGLDAACKYELRTTADALLGVGGVGAIAGGPRTILLSKGGLRAASQAPGGVPVEIRGRSGRLRATATARLFVQGLKLQVPQPRHLPALARKLRRAGVAAIACRGKRAAARAACGALRAAGLHVDTEVEATTGATRIVVTYSAS